MTDRCAYTSGLGGPRCMRAAHKNGRCKAHARLVLEIASQPCPRCAWEGESHRCVLCGGTLYVDVAKGVRRAG